MLIVGCGYVGRRLARHYLDRGQEVTGLVRSDESRAALAAEGIPALSADLATGSLRHLALAGERVFHLAPPPAKGEVDVHTRRLVAAFGAGGGPRRLVYLSTTGVYGDCGGAWVDETWPPAPGVDRARRRWDAESSLRRWSGETGGELVILRVAGIYGPGRLPLERIRRGLPLVSEAESPFSNRVHVDDLVAACAAAMERGRPGGVYNVCDGNPSTMTDYFFRVADAVGLPRPPVIPLDEAAAELSAGMLSYLRESRRLSNRRMREELGVTPRYPDLAAGLAACLADGGRLGGVPGSRRG
jgi:nucleoside-diphosphate-sugar epimerase